MTLVLSGARGPAFQGRHIWQEREDHTLVCVACDLVCSWENHPRGLRRVGRHGEPMPVLPPCEGARLVAVGRAP